MIGFQKILEISILKIVTDYVHWWAGIFVQVFFSKTFWSVISGNRQVSETNDDLFERPNVGTL